MSYVSKQAPKTEQKHNYKHQALPKTWHPRAAAGLFCASQVLAIEGKGRTLIWTASTSQDVTCCAAWIDLK